MMRQMVTRNQTVTMKSNGETKVRGQNKMTVPRQINRSLGAKKINRSEGPKNRANLGSGYNWEHFDSNNGHSEFPGRSI